jgi:hypothetical protein
MVEEVVQSGEGKESAVGSGVTTDNPPIGVEAEVITS